MSVGQSVIYMLIVEKIYNIRIFSKEGIKEFQIFFEATVLTADNRRGVHHGALPIRKEIVLRTGDEV